MAKLADREAASKQTKSLSPVGGRQVLFFESKCLGATFCLHCVGGDGCVLTHERVMLQLTRSGNPFLANQKVICARVWVLSGVSSPSLIGVSDA